MDASNLSLLVNADELVRGGFVEDKEEGERVSGLLRAEIDGIHTTRQLRYRLNKGGRLYVSEETRGRLAAWRERMRTAARESKLGKGLTDILGSLRSINALSGDARLKALANLEAKLPQFFGGKPETEWMRHLLQGEIDRLRGGESLRSAQSHFRKAIRDGEGNVRLAFERLLVIDIKLAIARRRRSCARSSRRCSGTGTSSIRWRRSWSRRKGGPMKLPKLSRGKWSLAFGILAVFLTVVIFSRQRLKTAVVFAVVTAVVVCECRLKRTRAEEAQSAPSEAPEKPSPAPVVSAAAEASRPADPPPPAPLPEKAEKYLRIARFAFDRKALVEANFWAKKRLQRLADGGNADAARYLDFMKNGRRTKQTAHQAAHAS